MTDKTKRNKKKVKQYCLSEELSILLIHGLEKIRLTSQSVPLHDKKTLQNSISLADTTAFVSIINNPICSAVDDEFKNKGFH